jgi:sigma-70-like protein
VLRPELLAVAEALAGIPAPELSLDQIADAVGSMRISADEIDALFAWLEARGRVVGDPSGPGAAALLGQVLVVARGLRAELGRPPQPREIAERSALSLDAVQRALWFARILQR